ncbi:MAG: recombinase family protein [Proteobacteria bacterium]|nr:recombinase family protein [Pseudomonadota bacterium]
MTKSRRAAIYARFSTDKQSEKSTEDQAALCRNYAQKNGFEVVRVYADKAISGSTLINRPRALELIADAKSGKFEVLIIEALDRLSRDMEDLAGLYKRMTHWGVEIRAVHEGVANTMLVGLKGTMGALYLKDLADKTRRGLSGVVRDGRHAGGKAYGYRTVSGKRGELEIVKHEAEIVREIFSLYVSGKTPREIAKSLNAREVLPPRGRYWNASTINGSRARRNGIIMNDLYAGTIVWNRQSFTKDPDTGKRISRPNPQSEWQSREAPHLRIVPDGLWQGAQVSKAARGGSRPHTKRKHKYLLSGLLKCGCCGAGMTVHDTRNGRVRLRCARMYEAGACDNRTAYDMRIIEKLVFDALRPKFSTPAMMADFVSGYNERLRRRSADSTSRRAKTERGLAEARASIERWQKLYVAGHATDAEMAAHVPKLREQVACLEAELATIEQPPAFIDVHPQAIAAYKAMLDNLPALLARDSNGEPSKKLRDLIGTIIVKPSDDEFPMRLEIRGNLAVLVTAAKIQGVSVMKTSHLGDNVGCGGPQRAVSDLCHPARTGAFPPIGLICQA